MIPTLIISSITIVALILSVLLFPKLKVFGKELNTYWMVGLIGMLLLLIFGCIPIKDVFNELTTDTSVNPLKILVLFFSMTILSIALDEVGFFKYLATIATNKAKTNQLTLFIILYLLVSVLTVFTSNDIVILTFTPFICYFAKNSKINPIPYLVAEFAAANTWSMMLIIGNPTNIYLATSANIDFISYLKVMVLPTLAAGIVEFLLILLIFRKQLKTPLNIETEVVKIQNKVVLILGLIHLGICLILLIISSYISLDMWLISLCCALSLILSIIIYSLIKKEKFTILLNTFKRLPWDLIPFVISMFIIVLSLNNNGITHYLTELLGEDYIILKYGYSSFISCNLINNIPMSVLFSSIPHMPTDIQQLQAIYSTIIGSNIGAFLTPIGALAGIMFTGLISKQQIKYTFLDFFKYGSLISIPTITVALLVLMLVL
ncbi:MAG: SLC13 family permease [Bacilli bacterium]